MTKKFGLKKVMKFLGACSVFYTAGIYALYCANGETDAGELILAAVYCFVIGPIAGMVAASCGGEND